MWDGMPESVKKRYKWEAGTLFLNKSEISNYFVCPIKKLKTPSEKRELLLVQYVVGEDEEVIEYMLDITEPSKLKLPVNMTCVDYKRNSRNELLTLLKMQMPLLSEFEWYIDSIGWHEIDNHWIYCAGNETFLSQSDIAVHIAPVLSEKFQIIKNSELAAKSILESVKELISLGSTPVNICLLYLVTSLLRSLFFKANVPPQFVLYLYGKTQTYKTTTAKYFFDIYNQANGNPFALEDLTSSEAALQGKIGEFRDCIFILDDLSDGASKSETIRKKNAVNDFIRTAANCNPRRTKSGSNICGEVYECSIAITGEYIIEIESIINRTVLVDMEKHLLSNDVLNFYGSHPMLPALFSRVFLEWAAKHTDFIINQIKTLWNNYRNMETDASISPRFKDSIQILFISCGIMLEFFRMHGINMNGITGKFPTTLSEIIEDEENIIKMLRIEKEKFNIAKEIINLLNDKKIVTVPSVFQNADAYKKNGVLCIMPEYLYSKLDEAFPNENLTIHKISSYLKKGNFLILDKSKDCTKKNKNGRRYYHINLEKLVEEAGIEIVR